MAGNQLILGLAAGYHYGDIRPFLVSLERAEYQGELILFVSKTTRNLDLIGKHNVTIIQLERAAGLEEIPYNALRYFLYLDYLKSARRDFKRILISDVRDVIFQLNPFDFSWPKGINCALEDKRMTIGKCPYNSHWVRTYLGKKALAEIAENQISCSGTTIADHASMLIYLETLTARLTPYTPEKHMAGYDQGLHNYLVHTSQFPNLTFHDNSGPILTLGHTKENPKIDADGFILNTAGSRAHMVHQYDRKPDLHTNIREKYT
jgi:hypothetical protein